MKASEVVLVDGWYSSTLFGGLDEGSEGFQ